MEYTPYRYTLHEPDDPMNGYRLVVMARSDTKIRRQFSFPVYPLLAVQLEEPKQTLQEMKESLGTSHVTYDRRANLFIVRADTKIDRKDFNEVTPIPLTVSTALWNLDHDFFGRLNDKGFRLSTYADERPFISIVWCFQTTADGNIGWISYYRSDEETPRLLTSVGSPTRSERDIISAFLAVMAEVDIDAGTPEDWSVLLRRARIVQAVLPTDAHIVCRNSHLALDIPTLEHIDMLALGQRLFPHFSFHDLNELYVERFEVGFFNDPGPIEEWMHMTVSRYRKLYDEIIPQVYNLAALSRCNLGDLTRDDLYKDILRPYSYELSVSPVLTGLIPSHFTSIGKFHRVFGYRLGRYLHHLLHLSSDATTHDLATWSDHIKEYGWIMRPIYCLEGLRPAPFGGDFVAFHNDVLYTSENLHYLKPEVKWSLLVCPIPGELIRVTLTSEKEVLFSYQGNSVFCLHPYAAIRSAVQLYLTCYTSGGSKLKPEVVATTVPLDGESTAITRTVTYRNLDQYMGWLSDSELKIVREGGETKIRLWKSEGGETRDRAKFRRADYIAEMTCFIEILTKI